ncbi:MAG: T9SS type A sorting domain-containing protein [Bacteroidales bacterium]|nr:T9SS type A sorting domain-containing protein [Bacteroidales bacterium]
MKKSLLLALVLMLSCSLFSQSRMTYLKQTFDSEGIPSDWTIMGVAQDNWSIWPTNQAGGDPGEIKLYWRPAFNGTTRLVSPAVNTTGLDEIIFSFKGFLDNYMNVPHQVGIATSSDDGTTWNTVWEESFATPNQGQHSFIQTIDNDDIGKENVRFCIYYTGDSNNMNGWYFDDIEVYTLDELNLSLLSIDFPSIVNIDATEVGFKVQSTGITTVTSFEAQYQVEGREPVVETFSTELESTDKADFVFQTPLTLAPGTYNMNVKILKVNGSDDIASDNEASTSIDAAIGTIQRTPMIEHFSNSNCGPCVYVNQSMGILLENNPGKYTYTKYAARLFFDGDDYYTDESMAKYTYYNVVGLPQVFFDGVDYGAAAVPAADFAAEYNRPAYIDIKGSFNMQDSVINVIVDVTALVNIPEFRLLASVNEKTTTGNVGANGETEFHHIMLDMLDDEEGTATSLNVGEVKRFEFTSNLSGTFVEELNDLEVAVWAQDYYSKEVYNSHYMYEYTDAHPHPIQNLNIEGSDEDATVDVTWDAPEAGAPIGYNLYVNNELVLENTTEMSYHIDNAAGIYTIIVAALYENDMTSIGVADHIVIGDDVFPCFAPTNPKAEVEQDAAGYEHSFKVTLSWDTVDNAKEYVIYIDDEIPVNTTETSYIVGYDEEGTHEFKVATICEAGISEPSETVAFELIGVSIEEHETSLSIYPNPAKDNLVINTDMNIKEINIYNVVGINVYQQSSTSVDNCPMTIDISSYNAGVYFIKVNTDKGEFIKQFIKE